MRSKGVMAHLVNCDATYECSLNTLLTELGSNSELTSHSISFHCMKSFVYLFKSHNYIYHLGTCHFPLVKVVYVTLHFTCLGHCSYLCRSTSPTFHWGQTIIIIIVTTWLAIRTSTTCVIGYRGSHYLYETAG